MDRIALILVNLGTPSQPTASAIRQYLKEFLGDKRVIELPSFLWKPILHGFILPFRPRKLIPKYQSIWLDGGSPLMVYGKQLVQQLNQHMQQAHLDVTVRLAMTYGEPRIHHVLHELQQEGIERFLILPLYPQYSATTTAPIVDQVAQYLQTVRNQPEVRFVKRFYQHDAFIQATCQKIAHHLPFIPDKLLLSYHGLPQRYIDQGDPYYHDCLDTTARIQQHFPHLEIETAFQSQFGRAKWISPSTEHVIRQYAQQGVRNLIVHSPCFMADCLETLEEINQEYRELFIQAGGQQFHYIPCLNDDAAVVQALYDIVYPVLNYWD